MRKFNRLFCAILLVALICSPFSDSFAAGESVWSGLRNENSQEEAWAPIEEPAALEDWYVFISSNEALTDTCGLNEGQLYKRNLETGETVLLVAETVTAIRFFNERIWFSQGNTIFSITPDGDDKRTEYTGSLTVDYFTPGDKALLIENDGYLYKVDLRTRQPHLVCSLDGILTYQPETLNTVSALTETEECIINLITGAKTIDSEDDVDSENDIVPYASSSYTINGVSIPVRIPQVSGAAIQPLTKAGRSYRYGEFFTDGSVFKNPDGGSLFTYNSASGCSAFAQYVYSEIWGTRDYGHHTDYANGGKQLNETSAKTYYRSLPAGTRVRLWAVQTKLNENDEPEWGHSIILLAANNTEIDVYHANWGSPTNVVHISSYKYGSLDKKFLLIVNDDRPHTFNSGSAVSAGPNGHYINCSYSGCSQHSSTTVPHYIIGTPGYGTCAACGYYGFISTGTTSLPTEPPVIE